MFPLCSNLDVRLNRGRLVLATPALREFRLTRDGVQCGEAGLGYIPRLKHEQITAAYNSKYLGNPANPLTRQVVGALDFNAQREAGLAALREAGVLK